MVHFRTKQIAPRVTEIRGVIYERMYHDVPEGFSDRIPYSFRVYHGFIAKTRLPHSMAAWTTAAGI